MKRELKFKAWDTLKKMFVPQGEIIFSDYGDNNIEVNPNCIEYIGDDCHNGEPQRSRFIIVQFTGKKDKEGNDIYEGDIIKPNEIDRGGEVRYSDQMNNYNLHFNNGCASLGTWEPSVIKIIGNIFEHEVLLHTGG